MDSVNQIFTAKSVKQFLKELSDRNKKIFYTGSDVAIYGLACKRGMGKQWTDTEKSKASQRVCGILHAMEKGALGPLKSEGKIDPLDKHYPGVSKATGYRFGKPEDTTAVVVAKVLERSPPPSPNSKSSPAIWNALADALFQVEPPVVKVEEIPKVEPLKRDSLGYKEPPTERVKTLASDIYDILKGLSYAELNDVKVEIDCLQQSMYDKLEAKVNSFNATVKLLAE